MKKLLAVIAAVVCVSVAQAQSILTFRVDLTPGEDGGGGRTGTGGGTLTFNTAANTLTFNNIPWSGLSADSTATHIHGSATSGPFPSSAGVLYNLTPTYSAVGAGIRSGTYTGTLPLVAGTGGFTLAQQVDQLTSGRWYLNVHSTAFTGGEIRGQILQVPEPSVYALGGLGLAIIALRRFVRR